MVSRIEIEAITQIAEEREHQKYLMAREKVKEGTRQYCSSTLSDLLRAEADKPARHLDVKVTIPDSDKEVHLITKDSDGAYYSSGTTYYNIDTLMEFTKEHGFEVSIEDSTYKYTARTTYGCKKVVIKW